MSSETQAKWPGIYCFYGYSRDVTSPHKRSRCHKNFCLPALYNLLTNESSGSKIFRKFSLKGVNLVNCLS